MRLSLSDVATGVSQTGNEPAPQRIAGSCHDNRDRRGRTLGGQRPERAGCYDDFNVEANQFCREFREPFEPIFRIAPLDGDVLPLDPSQLQ